MARDQAGSMQRWSPATSEVGLSSPRASPGSTVSWSQAHPAPLWGSLWQPKVTMAVGLEPYAPVSHTCQPLPLQICVESDTHGFHSLASTGLASRLVDLNSGSPGHMVNRVSAGECPSGKLTDSTSTHCRTLARQRIAGSAANLGLVVTVPGLSPGGRARVSPRALTALGKGSSPLGRFLQRRGQALPTVD